MRGKSKISYHTSLPTIFGPPSYATALNKLCLKRDLNINLRSNLIKVDSSKKVAYFEKLDEPNSPPVEVEYNMLHATPPMKAANFLKPLSTDATNGFVSVDSKTLQHTKYDNIFALGDCSSLPTSKTAAAIASQNYILSKNLQILIENNGDKGKCSNKFLQYDGYTSCPLVTGNNKCIMAEFDYTLKPLETFPVDQSKERMSMYYVKKDILPAVYWNGLLKYVVFLCLTTSLFSLQYAVTEAILAPRNFKNSVLKLSFPNSFVLFTEEDGLALAHTGRSFTLDSSERISKRFPLLFAYN